MEKERSRLTFPKEWDSEGYVQDTNGSRVLDAAALALNLIESRSAKQARALVAGHHASAELFRQLVEDHSGSELADVAQFHDADEKSGHERWDLAILVDPIRSAPCLKAIFELAQGLHENDLFVFGFQDGAVAKGDRSLRFPHVAETAFQNGFLVVDWVGYDTALQQFALTREKSSSFSSALDLLPAETGQETTVQVLVQRDT